MCKLVLNVFLAAWFIAVALLGVGYFGLFGAEKDPLSGVFLIPLGLPWNMLGSWAPEFLLPWIGILAPAINYSILQAICRRVRRSDK